MYNISFYQKSFRKEAKYRYCYELWHRKNQSKLMFYHKYFVSYFHLLNLSKLHFNKELLHIAFMVSNPFISQQWYGYFYVQISYILCIQYKTCNKKSLKNVSDNDSIKV